MYRRTVVRLIIKNISQLILNNNTHDGANLRHTFYTHDGAYLAYKYGRCVSSGIPFLLQSPSSLHSPYKHAATAQSLLPYNLQIYRY